MSGADNVGKACAPEHAGTGQGRPSFDPDPVPCPGWGIEAFLDAVYGGAKPSRRYRHREVLLDMDRLLDHKIGLSRSTSATRTWSAYSTASLRGAAAS